MHFVISPTCANLPALSNHERSHQLAKIKQQIETHKFIKIGNFPHCFLNETVKNYERTECCQCDPLRSPIRNFGPHFSRQIII